jgi:tripartite-type tricarboxylate transporter receptor subunit TctC
MNRRNFALSATAAAALGGFALPSWAQAWPTKSVRLILSQPPGAGPDVMARLVTDQLSRKWGQAIVVDNRPGGQNLIGAQAAAKSTPDGYTFYFATSAAMVTNSYLFKNLPYDPLKDFTPVGMIGRVPFVLSVNPKSPLKSLKDVVKFAKANPGKLAVANEGPMTFGGIMTRLLASQLGIEVNAVPYVAVTGAVTDAVGGQIEALITDRPAVAEMVKAGKLRPIVVTTAQRVVGWDSVPAISETIPGFDYAGWVGFVAPAGTPAEAIQRFNHDLDAVLKNKEIADRLATIGPVTKGAGTPDQMRAFLKAEHARWSKLTKDLGIQPQ